MKKSFFGYNVSEVDISMNSLREENESLNATITSLKTHIKNIETGNSAKSNLLESDLKNMEDTLRETKEEKEKLESQVDSLTSGTKELNLQNEILQNQIIDLTRQIAELTDQVSDKSAAALETLQSKLDSELDHKTSQEKLLNDAKEELYSVKEELKNTKALLEQKTQSVDRAQVSFEEKVIELEDARREIEELKDELTISKIAVDDQAKIKAREKKQLANFNYASEISLQAYYDMSLMRNEVIEYIHKHMKEYYQLVNENNTKMRTALEQRQSEYNKMIRDFSEKLSEFRLSLSSIESDYNNMGEYNINIDQISHRMNEIMNNFIEESSTSLKKNEVKLNTDEYTKMFKPSSKEDSDETEKKSLNIQDFRPKKNEKQNYL